MLNVYQVSEFLKEKNAKNCLDGLRRHLIVRDSKPEKIEFYFPEFEDFLYFATYSTFSRSLQVKEKLFSHEKYVVLNLLFSEYKITKKNYKPLTYSQEYTQVNLTFDELRHELKADDFIAYVLDKGMDFVKN